MKASLVLSFRWNSADCGQSYLTSVKLTDLKLSILWIWPSSGLNAIPFLLAARKDGWVEPIHREKITVTLLYGSESVASAVSTTISEDESPAV